MNSEKCWTAGASAAVQCEGFAGRLEVVLWNFTSRDDQRFGYFGIRARVNDGAVRSYDAEELVCGEQL